MRVMRGKERLLWQVRNLRERLEEEHQALLQREQDKAVLEVRIARLTRIILHSTRIAKPNPSLGYRYRQLLLRECQVLPGSLSPPAALTSLEVYEQGDPCRLCAVPQSLKVLQLELAGPLIRLDQLISLVDMLQPADVSPPNPRKPHIQTPGGSTPLSGPPSDRPRSSDGSSERSGPMTPGQAETPSPSLQPNGESSGCTGNLFFWLPLSSH